MKKDPLTDNEEREKTRKEVSCLRKGTFAKVTKAIEMIEEKENKAIRVTLNFRRHQLLPPSDLLFVVTKTLLSEKEKQNNQHEGKRKQNRKRLVGRRCGGGVRKKKQNLFRCIHTSTTSRYTIKSKH